MQAIYSSKLYKSSLRKDKIRAGISDPVNVELVKQLRSYLDPEYITEEYLDTDAVDKKHDDNYVSDDVVNEESTSIETEEIDSKSEENAEPTDDTVDEEEGESSDNDSEFSSTYVDKAPINASESPVDFRSTLIDEIDLLKSSLNTREDTSGVARIRLDEDEVWIHYNDKTNLNDVMEPVISYLNSAYFDHLEFNRLARTQNAIVFTVSETKLDLNSVDLSEK